MEFTTTMGIYGGISLICTIWVLYEVWAVNRSLSTGGKVLWTIVALMFNVIGAIAYYFIEKNKRAPEASDTLV